LDEPDPFPTAPPNWWYHSFPLRSKGEEVISIDWVADLARERIDRAETLGDEAPLGPTLHWAHLLKIEQGPKGDWPAWVNARTGAPVGTARTLSPVRLLERLGALLRSDEFKAAVERVCASGPISEPISK